MIRDVVDCPNADAFMLLLDGIIFRGDSKRVIRELESYQPSRTELPAISVALGALFSYEAGSSASPLAKMTATAKAFHHLDRALGERPSWSLALYLRGALETSVPAIVRKQLCRSGPPERDLHQAILLASAEPGESLVAAAAHVYLGRYCMKLRKKKEAHEHFSLARKLDAFGRISLTRDETLGLGKPSREWKPSGGLRKRLSGVTRQFYIMPIFSTVGVSSRKEDIDALRDMKTRLGSGGDGVTIGFSEVYGYMNETLGPEHDYNIDPRRLEYILSLSTELRMPVMVHLNGGNWCDFLGESRLSLHDYLEKDRANVQWYHDNTVDSDDDPCTELGNEVFLTHSLYAERVMKYKRRNLVAASRILYAFYLEHPDLLVGVTSDSEVNMNSSEMLYRGKEKVADYNPLVIREFREEMARAYGEDIGLFNKRNETSFKGFGELDPPRHLLGQDHFWEEWTRFRLSLVRNHVKAMVEWIRETGLPEYLVYSHQLPYEICEGPSGRVLGCNDISTGVVDGGGLGINLTTGSVGEYPRRACMLKHQWGVTELADLYVKEEGLILEDLDAIYTHGARFVAPFYWAHRLDGGYFEGPEQLTYYMKQTRINGSPFERAISKFVQVFKG